jgi:hypothetical protein
VIDPISPARAQALLLELADIAYWGPRGPEGSNHPEAETFSGEDAVLRLGMIIGSLWKHGVYPRPAMYMGQGLDTGEPKERAT